MDCRSPIFARLYNDVLYLCEKYAPFPCSDKYDPEKDITVTGNYTHFEMSQLQE